MADEHIHVAPPGASLDEVAAEMVSRLGSEVEQSGGIIIVIEGRPGSSSAVAVLPADERRRIEQHDPRFVGKLVAIIPEKDAMALGIMPQTPVPALARQRGAPPVGKRLTPDQRRKLAKEREKAARRKKRGN